MLFIKGGDKGPGEGLELLILTLLEEWWLFPFLLVVLALLNLIKLDKAGEVGVFIHSAPGLLTMLDIIGPFSFEAAGVFNIGSSISRSMSSSDVVSLSDPESSMLMLLTELDRVVLSAFGIFDHRELDKLLGESSTVLPRLLLCGICIPRPPIVGDASGDDSASVE